MRKILLSMGVAVVAALGLAAPAVATEPIPSNNDPVDAFETSTSCELVEIKFVNMTDHEVIGEVRVDGDDFGSEIMAVPAQDDLLWSRGFEPGSGVHKVEFRVWGWLDWGNRLPVEVDCGTDDDKTPPPGDDDNDGVLPGGADDDAADEVPVADGDLPKTGGSSTLPLTLAGIAASGLGGGLVFARRRGWLFG